MHICILLQKEHEEQDDTLLLHGGEYNNRILFSYNIFNLNKQHWMKTEPLLGKLVPQLKSHSFGYYKITEKNKAISYIIISGGITIEHDIKCYNKEFCDCDNLILSDQIYIYYRETFTPVVLEDKNDFQKTVRRYGHSMFNLANGKLYMIGGFVQYEGYVIDIIEMNISIKNKVVSCKCNKIELMTNKIKGRMYCSVSVVFNKIILFGGVRDTRTLNDMWVIDFEDIKNPITTEVEIDKKVFLPRFGMSTATQHDSHDGNLYRIMILGGSYFNDDNFSEGVTNELLVFSVSV